MVIIYPFNALVYVVTKIKTIHHIIRECNMRPQKNVICLGGKRDPLRIVQDIKI